MRIKLKVGGGQWQLAGTFDSTILQFYGSTIVPLNIETAAVAAIAAVSAIAVESSKLKERLTIERIYAPIP